MEDIYKKFLEAKGLSTDSREDVGGKFFVALKGDTFDANDFIEQVLDTQVKYIVTTRKDFAENPKVISVDDTLEALQQLAAHHRKQFSIPMIAIGGSNGKTTTKELVAGVLEQKFKVLKTEGNLNNHIGVAKTLLNLSKNHEIAVIEMGANHQGEHLVLMNIAQPTHILVTNNGLDHLAGFGSPENVRKANKEIYDWAQNKDMSAFVDESQEDLVQDSEGLNRIFYSPNETACESNLAGDFNKINILAAMKVGETFDVSSEKIAQAIKNYKPGLLRSESLEYRGAHWIVDCYNANPSSMKVAIDSFVNTSKGKKKGFILGGMRELGSYSESEHQKLVGYIMLQNPDLLVLVGEEFSVCSLPEGAHYFKTSIEAKLYLDSISLEGFNLLLKGSRGIKMEVIIDRKL